MGVTSIITRSTFEDLDKQIFHFKAVVKGLKIIHGEPREVIYSFHGDANADNVSRMVRDSIRRVAETRAVARALRAYCSVAMCSLEELKGEKVTERPSRNRSNKISPSSARAGFTDINVGELLHDLRESPRTRKRK